MARSFKEDYLRGLGTGGTVVDTPVKRTISWPSHSLTGTASRPAILHHNGIH